MDAHRLTGFDGLRAIAALSVLLFHLLTWQTGTQRGNAYLAVDFFFMLSGYVMARTYEDKLACGLSPATFIYARFCRFWPTMFVAGLIGLPWFVMSFGMAEWRIAAINLLLIPALHCIRPYPLNGPAWSILLELIANMLHAVILRRLSTTGLVATIAATGLLLALCAIRASFDVGAVSATFLPALLRVTFSYTIGILLWRWWRDKPPVTIAPSAALLAMPVFFGVTTAFGIDGWQYAFLFILLICPLMLAGALRWSMPSRSITSRAMAVGGSLSFPVYAFHAPICMTVIWMGWPVIWGVVPTLIAAHWFVQRDTGIGRHIANRRLARAAMG